MRPGHYASLTLFSPAVSTDNDPESVYTGSMLDAIIPFFGGLVAVPVQVLLALRASAVRTAFLLSLLLCKSCSPA